MVLGNEDILQKEVRRLTREIELWHNRAEIAYSQANRDLSIKALTKKHLLRCALAEVENRTSPNTVEDPDQLFRSVKRNTSDSSNIKSPYPGQEPPLETNNSLRRPPPDDGPELRREALPPVKDKGLD